MVESAPGLNVCVEPSESNLVPIDPIWITHAGFISVSVKKTWKIVLTFPQLLKVAPTVLASLLEGEVAP
jgi:hypothetical protein